MSMPFQLDTAVDRLARSYLAVAARKPQSSFTTGDPIGFIDWVSLRWLEARGLIRFEDQCFQATTAGVEAHHDFLTCGR